jgi:hypothetical protein
MAFARMFNNPNVTKEQYDAVRAKMGIGNDNVPEGGIIHFAGEGPDGSWRVVEVWGSEDDARAWDEKLEPVLSERGITRPAPETWQVHNLIKS